MSVFSGSSDGCHWGLWYDDPNELPLGIVVNHARDSAETSTCEETLLATLQANVEGRRYAFEEPFNPTEWPRRTAILQWLELVLARELDVADHQRKRDTRKPPNLIGGVGSVDPKWALPAELDGKVEQEARLAAYRRRDPIVNDWIALAQKELAAGSAGRALHYGRELHWIDADEWRAECTELLIGAYKQLDRLALAEIVRVHHAHRDLASVSVFEAVDSGSTARTTDEVDFETADLLESLRDAGGDLAPEFAEHVRVQVIASFTRHGARRSSLRCCARLGSR